MRLILVALLLGLVGAACSSELSESDKSEIIQLIQEHSIPGSQGSVGPQGVRGEQGPPGPRDTEGPQGVRGEQGPPGPRGAQGPQGIQGEQGPPGPGGAQGPQGIQGEQGSLGPRGAQGPQGIQGEQGDVAEYDTPATTTISPTPSEVISGRGDSVINCQLRPGRTVIQLTHQGDSNFIIQLHDDEGDREYLVNEIGFYSGSRLISVGDDSYSSLSPGQCFMEIEADGDWSLTRVQGESVFYTPSEEQSEDTDAAPTVISTPADLVGYAKGSIAEVRADYSGGTGFIFDVEGQTAFIATNHHVIDDADNVRVRIGARTYGALVLGWDSTLDVAVLSACCSSSFAALSLEEESSAVATGGEVIAIGYPSSGSNDVTATVGITLTEYWLNPQQYLIQHTAPLNPGSSGGPLFSMPEAKVIGITNARSSESLIFYAVPIGSVKPIMEKWRSQLVSP